MEETHDDDTVVFLFVLYVRIRSGSPPESSFLPFVPVSSWLFAWKKARGLRRNTDERFESLKKMACVERRAHSTSLQGARAVDIMSEAGEI